MDPQRPTGPRPAPSLLERLLPPVMDARDVYRRHARAYGVLAAAILVLGLVFATDDLGRVLMVLIAIPFGVRAGLAWRKLRQAGADDKIVRNVDGLPVAERAPALRRILWVGASALAALSGWTAWSLWALEAGREESVYVWGPIWLVYRYFGFWPAVLTLPVFGVLFVGSGASKMRRLEAEARAAALRSAPPS